jgi:tryptophan synthase alpha chain
MFEILAATPHRPPTLVMTYLNPVLAYGAERFVRDARACGVAGLILTDLPPEDGDDLFACMQAADLASVLLVAPTTPTPRMAAIAARATGFLYCVAVRGTTGARATVGTDAATTVARARSVTALPVLVGFGISTPEQVRATCRYADGVVVGSALVDVVRQHAGRADLLDRFAARHDELAAAAHAPSGA